MLHKISFLALAASAVTAQQVGTYQAETHPSLTWQRCTTSGGCTTVQGSVTIDANWRWTHLTGTTTNCYTGNTWNSTACPNGATCAANCALEGANYASTYGITTSGNALTLKFVTSSDGRKNIGSRVYLMEDDNNYVHFNMLGKEFTFTVDMSQLPCGLNGALYTVEMAKNGGASTTNKAGAKYGTGYCDAQCPHDMKWIQGEANSVGWTPDSNSENTGKGQYGACCAEMDIWEANSIATAYTPHTCSKPGLTRCASPSECGDNGPTRYEGVCDKDGCDFNAFRQGVRDYLGPGTNFTVNTLRPITVVTQFLTGSGGGLSEIRRLYVQDGRVIPHAVATQPAGGYDSITDQYCNVTKTLFGDFNHYAQLGGQAGMGASMARGHVLAMSLWDDYYARMLWLDSNYPTDADPATPGVARGTCPTTSGVPAEVEAQYPNISVTYSNIRFGDIGSTYTGGTGSTTGGPGTTTTRTTSTGGCTVPKWGQCGGQGYTGCTTCASGSTCRVSNPWYSQCL